MGPASPMRDSPHLSSPADCPSTCRAAVPSTRRVISIPPRLAPTLPAPVLSRLAPPCLAPSAGVDGVVTGGEWEAAKRRKRRGVDESEYQDEGNGWEGPRSDKEEMERDLWG